MSSDSNRPGAIRAAVVGTLIAILLPLAGCTGKETGNEPPQSDTSAGAPTPSIAHDGRTLLPASLATACQILGPEAIRRTLGDLASNLQAAQPSAVQDAAGVKKDSCIYPFDAGGLITNAVVVEVTTYPSPESMADDAFKLMTDPEEVPGLGDRAKFAVNSLSGTSEYILTVVSGPRATRVLVALPSSDSHWSKAEGREVLETLAGQITF